MEVKDLLSNCASCVIKPCQIGCPLNNDITGFIKEMKNENYKGAFDILSNTTVLMSLCGRICPHFQQCQGKCVKGISYNAVEIGKLESIIGDIALENNWTISVPKKTKYHVAVIGGGPAGLTCAAFLRRNGIKVTIYEKHNYLGGIMVHGIPEFRLPKDLVKKVTDSIINLGIDVKYNQELGKDYTLEKIKEKYDAVFIGIGANLSNKMNIQGENTKGVYGANEILENNNHPEYKDKVVIVSGGGNVAMDISRTAKRMGAKKVVVIYRRSEAEMPADKKEIEEAKEEGVEFLFLTTITKIIGKDKVEKLELLKNELVKKENDLRPSPVPIAESNYEIVADYVMMAIGSHSDEYITTLKLAQEKGKIKIDEKGKTSDEKVFSGGDIAGTKGTVAWASRAGRNAAYSIIEYLNK